MSGEKNIPAPHGVITREEWVPHKPGEDPFDYIQRDIYERVKRKAEKNKKDDKSISKS